MDPLTDTIAGKLLVHGGDTELTRDETRVTGPHGFAPALEQLERTILE